MLCTRCQKAEAHPEAFGLCEECDDFAGLYPDSVGESSEPDDESTIRLRGTVAETWTQAVTARLDTLAADGWIEPRAPGDPWATQANDRNPLDDIARLARQLEELPPRAERVIVDSIMFGRMRAHMAEIVGALHFNAIPVALDEFIGQNRGIIEYSDGTRALFGDWPALDKSTAPR